MATSTSDFKPTDFQDIVLGKQLGAGSFGTVNVGLLPDGRFVAVKAIDIKEEDAKENNNSEIKTHSSLSHRNIVRYLHSKIEHRNEGQDPRLIVYLEFVTGGSVTSIMKSMPRQRMPYQATRVYSRHMLEGLAYLHSRQIAHRDLKGDNLLISMDTGVAKLADFDQAKCFSTFVRKPGAGPSMMMGGAAATIAGTPFWMAPEVIENGDKGYDPFKADIWSMGCTVAEMLIGKAPWEPMQNMLGVLFKITAISEGKWPDAIPTDDATIVTPELKDFFNKVFAKDPKKRPNVTECLQHPFIKQ